MEILWRLDRHVPSVTDDPELWSCHRLRVDAPGREKLVILGASRVQLGVSLKVMKDRLPDYEVIQLAVDGRHPLAVLRDLADDDRFRGVVLCAITAMGFEKKHWNDQQEFVDYFHRRSTLNNRINRKIKTAVQERFVVVDPYLHIRRLINNLDVLGKLPDHRYLVTFRDRSREADYMRLNLPRLRNYRTGRIREIYAENPPPPPSAWERDAAETAPWVRKITLRGGRVIFLRLPTSGEHWAIDETFYPRNVYWDRIAALTGADTIHFMDEPLLNAFECPEGSHLDFRDARRFTGGLVNVLENKGWLHGGREFSLDYPGRRRQIETRPQAAGGRI